MDSKTKEFLQKLKDSGNWNNDYDYSDSKYNTNRLKIRVRDKNTNTFHHITPTVLLRGGGLSIINAEDKSEYLKVKMIEVHGNKYDYSKVKYKSSHSLIKIKCKIHGEFEQSPANHLNGRGCKTCGNQERLNKERLSTEDFLKKIKEAGHWNNKYDFTEIKYVNNSTPVIVIDKTLNTKHEQLPSKILSRGVFCGFINAIDKKDYAFKSLKKDGLYNTQYDLNEFNVTKTKELGVVINKKYNTRHLISFEALSRGTECGWRNAMSKNDYFIKVAHNVHLGKYSYENLNDIEYHSKIDIYCKKHKETFSQKVSNHLMGSGCPKCAGKNTNDSYYHLLDELNLIMNNECSFPNLEKVKSKNEKIDVLFKRYGTIHKINIENILKGHRPEIRNAVDKNKFIKYSFKEIHGDKYDYENVEYKSGKNEVEIICKKHGLFKLSPSSHLQGTGCATCGIGWNKERIINFINDIRNEDIFSMDPVELNMLIAQGRLPKEFEELVFTLEGTGENSLKSLKEKLGIDDNTENNEQDLQRINKELEILISSEIQETNEALMAKESPSIEGLELATIEERENKNLPSISNSDILVLDKELINTCDDEAVEFFIQYKLKKVWNEVINEKRNADDIKLLKGGKNSTRLRELFLEEYDKVVNYIPPQGYSFEREGKIAPPNMMQKLTVQRIKDYKRYGNWSGTGAGKTISFIIASREVNSKLTVVICLNSTISQLEEDILEVYPDSLVHTRFRKGQKFDRTRYNYLLLNYEKFQQEYTEERFQDLNENNLVDFIVLDEIHNTKQRDKDESKRRGAVMRLIGRSAEMNPNFHLLGMSATPVINNLIEAKSLLQLITGKEYDDISTRGTITNALKVFNQLLLNGIRYIPKYNIVLKELTGKNTEKLNIDGESLVESLKSNNNKDYLGLEKILLEPKLDSIKDYLKPKTILYTYFTDGNKIPHQIAKYVKSQGYSVGFYIGEQSTEDRETIKDRFVKGGTDILIASRTIGTGVDGLQNVCNRMILLTLPWTDSEYTQLKGRIYRQGSKFGDVEIIIPQVYVDLDDQRWSWDKQRLQLIRDKRTLADAAVDGIIPSKHIPTREKLCSDSLQALRKWKERVNEGKITIVAREDLVLPLRPEIIESLSHSLGDFSQLNHTWSVSKSENTFKRLKKDKSEWYYYHSLYSEKRKEWDEIPYQEIAKDLKGRPDWIIADMGCGENLLSKEIENKVYAFDYVALEGEDVVESDITNVPLDDNQVDAVVFSLSLMGSNHTDYLREGSRILKPYGSLFICEPKKKAESRMENLKKEIEDSGFKIIDIKPSSQFVYINAVKI